MCTMPLSQSVGHSPSVPSQSQGLSAAMGFLPPCLDKYELMSLQLRNEMSCVSM